MHTVSVRDSLKGAISDLNKKEKKEVNYSKGMRKSRCGLCVYYKPKTDKVEGYCEKVKGLIHADMWCKLFKSE